MKKILKTAIFSLMLSAAVPVSAKPALWIDPEEPPVLIEEVTEKKNIEAARASGFADYEIDYYHTKIAGLLKGINDDSLPEGPGDYIELTSGSYTRKIIRGTDAQGKKFVRVRVREGRGFSTEIYPQQFTYRVDCFLYPGANGLEKVMFQFARINHGKNNYVREIRRFIHPNPGSIPDAPQPQAGQAPAGQPAGNAVPAAMGNNSEIFFEYYEKPSNITPVWHGADGVPLADLSLNPDFSFKLHDPEKPLHYYRQRSVIRRYKKMLRSVMASLDFKIRNQDLERALIIEKVMDF